MGAGPEPIAGDTVHDGLGVPRTVDLFPLGLYERAWHIWTDEDEDWCVFRVRPCIQGET